MTSGRNNEGGECEEGVTTRGTWGRMKKESNDKGAEKEERKTTRGEDGWGHWDGRIQEEQR